LHCKIQIPDSFVNNPMKRLAIILTHPIQYYSPVFKLLHQRNKIAIKVFYTWGKSSIKKYDPGFDKEIEWDIPLLDGYHYEWVKNTSKDAGTHHFMGIVTPGLVDQLNLWQPDAMLIYGWGYHSHLKAIHYFKNKIPVLFRGDSTLLDEHTGTGMRAILKSIFLKWVYRHIDHAFYTGVNNKAYFKKYGLKEEQLSFAPHAIDNDRFAVQRDNEAKLLRQQLGINNEDLVIMFAGKLEAKKAPIQLLDAFIALNNPGAHLLFVGNGPLEDDLKFKAKKKSNIHFIAFQNQSQMPIVYQACNLFCLPSVGPGETWGLAINEAMACGKAILVSDKAGAAADLVIPGYNGLIFKAGSATNLLQCLDQLVNNGKSELIRLGENSKEKIKGWSFESQVSVIETFITE
jgi:glycosyltransferase involved in cell wall biosynthesis